MKVAVSGCGITGTATAFLLAKHGHEVTIFEQAEESRSIGAGILISPNGLKALADLNVEMFQESAKLNGMEARLVSGQRLVELQYQWLQKDLFGLGVHRGRLFSHLLDNCMKANVELVNGFRATNFKTTEKKVCVISESGDSVGPFDLLIAADGSRSLLREQVDIKTKVIEYDYAALWTTAPCDFQPGRLVQYVDGTQRLIGLLPIGQGQSSFFWGLKADGLEKLKASGFQRWQDEVLDACPDAASIFNTIDSFEQLTFARYQHVTMADWFDQKNRIVFLGDAAHATSPHLGQGANLGLEDAVCFANALKTSGNDFGDACLLFKKERKQKIKYYQQLTRLLTPFFQSEGSLRGVARNLVLPMLPRLPIARGQMLRTLSGFQNGWI